jgi:membrane-associated phospholipid phosphatase
MLQHFFLNHFDQQIASWFLNNRSYFGINIFTIISFFGNWRFLLPLMFIIVLILFFKNKKKFIIPFISVVLGAEIITLLGKLWFQRPRPMFEVFKEIGFSFPSGHATIAVAFYGYLAFILIKLSNNKYKLLIIISTIVIIALVGFSRLYLGVHYLSDILVGYLIGLIALFIGILFGYKNK